MQKNSYFRTVLRRRNVLSEAIFGMFLSFASYPRLLLEVFIRKNFGDRYFSLASVVTVICLLVFVPYLFLTIYATTLLSHVRLWDDIIMGNVSLYMFLSLFLLISIRRYLEIKQGPSVFDFTRYSLSSGDIHPLFFKVNLFGVKPNARMAETILEPLFFLIIGIILTLLNVSVGKFIIFCSIFYSLGYIAAYKKGDDFVKDKIDEMICNQEMFNAFVNDEDYNARGFRMRADKPSSKEQRRQMADEFVEYEEVPSEAL